MIINRAIAVESLNLIKQLIDADNEVYAKGYEDGMAAQAEVQKTLRPWVGLTEEDRLELAKAQHGWEDLCLAVEAKLKEKNS